jgi:predicted nucleic acid-binding protein
MQRLLRDGVVEIIGPIRQEILSGIRENSKFKTVRNHLRAFADLAVGTEDFETAAEYYSICRSAGIQGSFTDFLICAVSSRNDLAIFTDDKDFLSYKRVLPIRLYDFERIP